MAVRPTCSTRPVPGREQQTPTRIALTLTVAGDEVTFDFTGTDDQRPGNVNAVEAVTVERGRVRDPHGHRSDDPREWRRDAPGANRRARRDRWSRRAPPVAVGAGNVEVSQRVADVCLGALAQAVPERVGAASQGTMNNVLLGGDGWVHYETIGGGQGGRPWADGMSGVHTAMTNTLDTPVEAWSGRCPCACGATDCGEGAAARARTRAVMASCASSRRWLRSPSPS